MDKTTINTYNGLAHEYDEETKDFWSLFPNSIIEKFSENTKGYKKVLDMGSGPGRDGMLLKKRGLQIVCLDASTTMVQLCKDKGLEAFEGDLLKTPFNPNTFDGVWAYTSLLHIKREQFGETLNEIKRVLKSGGVFGLGLIEGNGEFYRESPMMSRSRLFAFYTDKEVRSQLEGHGFKIFYSENFTPKTRKYLNYLSIRK